MVGKVLSKTRAKMWERGVLYKKVLQLVLLCRSDSWVVTGEIIKVLEGFHHKAARRITGMTDQRTTGREW